MPKKSIKPSTYLYPTPVLIVSSQGKNGKPNIATISWAGVLCSEPPLIGVSIRPSRHTHRLISETREFVVNIPSRKWLKEADYCGTVSGRSSDKFLTVGFTAGEPEKVKAPLINECPLNLECKVKQVLPLGTHDLFIAEVVAAHVDDEVLEADVISMNALSPISYCPETKEYRAMGEKIGLYGFSRDSKA